MSELSKVLRAAIGKPNPKLPNAIHLSRPASEDTWSMIQKEIGAGWFKDRFLYLLGPGLERLTACLEAWSFLVPPPSGDRQVIGRNAYGSLLVLEGGDREENSVHVLDPFQIVYWDHSDLDLYSLFGNWIPRNQIPGFLDTALYDAWIKARGEPLEDEIILAPQVPVGLGGKMEPANFREEEIVAFYETRGPTYAKAFAKMGRPSPAPAGKKKKR